MLIICLRTFLGKEYLDFKNLPKINSLLHLDKIYSIYLIKDGIFKKNKRIHSKQVENK